MFAYQVQSEQTAKNAAIEHHSSQITAEQDLYKINETVLPHILEQRDYLRRIGYGEDHMTAKDHADYDKDSSNNEVIYADPVFFPYQQITYDRAKEYPYCCAYCIGADRMSEYFYCWVHVINQKQLPRNARQLLFQINLSVDHQADIAAAAAHTTHATQTPNMKKMSAA